MTDITYNVYFYLFNENILFLILFDELLNIFRICSIDVQFYTSTIVDFQIFQII